MPLQTNANMMFDEKSWNLCINWLWARQEVPLEVALKNGIPF
jgi:hypothetical protein